MDGMIMDNLSSMVMFDDIIMFLKPEDVITGIDDIEPKT